MTDRKTVERLVDIMNFATGGPRPEWANPPHPYPNIFSEAEIEEAWLDCIEYPSPTGFLEKPIMEKSHQLAVRMRQGNDGAYPLRYTGAERELCRLHLWLVCFFAHSLEEAKEWLEKLGNGELLPKLDFSPPSRDITTKDLESLDQRWGIRND